MEKNFSLRFLDRNEVLSIIYSIPTSWFLTGFVQAGIGTDNTLSFTKVAQPPLAVCIPNIIGDTVNQHGEIHSFVIGDESEDEKNAIDVYFSFKPSNINGFFESSLSFVVRPTQGGIAENVEWVIKLASKYAKNESIAS